MRIYSKTIRPSFFQKILNTEWSSPLDWEKVLPHPMAYTTSINSCFDGEKPSYFIGYTRSQLKLPCSLAISFNFLSLLDIFSRNEFGMLWCLSMRFFFIEDFFSAETVKRRSCCLIELVNWVVLLVICIFGWILYTRSSQFTRDG